jgi:hypothetical protein
MSHKGIEVSQDIIELISSEEADHVTPLMTKIYYRLLIAPSEWWESNEALRVRGSTREAVATTAMTELVNWLRVTPEEAQKALQWMQEKEIIIYLKHQGGREIEISMAGLYFPE